MSEAVTTIIQTRAETSPARDSRGGDTALPGEASPALSDAAPPRRVSMRGRPRRYDHETVLNLWAEGKTSREICAALGMRRPEAVCVIVARAYSLGDTRAKPHGRGPRPSPLTAEARRRGLSTDKLRRRILSIVCRDNLFDAVLGKPGEPA